MSLPNVKNRYVHKKNMVEDRCRFATMPNEQYNYMAT